jgi:hypothetical protein
MHRYEKDDIPCAHYRTWEENQAPLGSRVAMMERHEDCVCPDDDPAIEITYLKCSTGCDGYKPVEIAVCSKHGEYIKSEGCAECLYDEECEAQRMMDEELDDAADEEMGI